MRNCCSRGDEELIDKIKYILIDATKSQVSGLLGDFKHYTLVLKAVKP